MPTDSTSPLPTGAWSSSELAETARVAVPLGSEADIPDELRFRAGVASQTEGAELPTLTDRMSGSAGENCERLIDFIAAQGIELEFKESIAPALGISYDGRIAVLPGQAAAEEFSTLVHKLLHEMLHKAERRTATTKTVRETEAEAIAFVVETSIGPETGHASADYIHLYHGNAALLAESLEVIQRTSALILAAIEPPEQTEAAPVMAEAI